MNMEEMVDQIYDKRSKEYFLESYSSYQNSFFRSAIVTLWNLVVCDVFFKLEKLHDTYDDSIAKEILDKYIKLMKENNPTNWELNLLEEISNRIHLIDSIELEKFKHLQKLRHLSAHPIIENNNILETKLFSPSKYETRAMLENVLNGLLIKPPLFTKKIFDYLTKDLSENSKHLIDDNQLIQYMESKYFKKMNSEVSFGIFKSLWKIVFSLDNQDCQTNREINYRVLLILIDRNKDFIKKTYPKYSDFFSNILKDEDVIYKLSLLFSKHRFLFEGLNEETKIIISNLLDKTDLKIKLCWFLYTNLDNFYNTLLGYLSEKHIYDDYTESELELLRKFEDSSDWDEKFYTILVRYYGSAHSFRNSDYIFKTAIKPYLEKFSFKLLDEIVQVVDKNNQINGSFNAPIFNRLIYDRILEENRDYDISPYPNFKIEE
ncbi:TPA: hypothetical protein ACPSKY_000213 [Legionella bozemanae]